MAAGRSVLFGLNVDPLVQPAAQLLGSARRAESSGFDLIAIQDHPYQARHYDSMSLIAYLAAHTGSISFTPNVANLGLRPPAMLAKAAATLSTLLGGRIRLGVGAGASGGPIPAMGGTERRGRAMIEYAEQSIALMRAALRGEVVQAHSDQLDVRGYRAGPAVPEPVEVWLGAFRPRMLGVVGRVAEGWLSPISSTLKPALVPGLTAVIDAAAESAGRDPRTVRRIYNVAGLVGRGDEAELVGSVDRWVEWLVDWTERLGFHGYVFWPYEDQAEQALLFGNEVIPRVREALGATLELR